VNKDAHRLSLFARERERYSPHVLRRHARNRWLRWPAYAAAFLLANTCTLQSAHATSPFEDPYAVPDTPRPPTLPELTHLEPEATIESTIGALTPGANVPAAANHTSFTYVQRFALEVPTASRRYFGGIAYETALGGPPEGGSTRFYGRIVWATRTGLTFGGGLGFLLPTARFDENGDAAKVALAASAIRPWDYAFFNPYAFTVNPFIDVRAIDGNFVIQFRQGIDCAFIASGGLCTKLAGVSELYLGYRMGDVGAGLEVFQLYLLDSSVDDTRRAYFTISPSARILWKYVQPALSFTSSVGNILAPTTGNVFGVRLAATFVWDVADKKITKAP
jgi:hypothetical protein